MMIGNLESFAIESHIDRAYEDGYFKALGYYFIYLKNFCYGVREPEATMMNASHGAVIQRLKAKGAHRASFATEPNAGLIADSFHEAVYGETLESNSYFCMKQPEFVETISRDALRWVPDGDEAFDDGSYILQFDVDDRVRLVGFRLARTSSGWRHDPSTLHDLWLAETEYYTILEGWRLGFEAEWRQKPKESKTSPA